MPWKTFMYKALNTFVDDLFAFIIKMPTLHRAACFRDDIVFMIFLYQRWVYKVDHSRVNEFGQRGEGGEGGEGCVRGEGGEGELEAAGLSAAAVEGLRVHVEEVRVHSHPYVERRGERPLASGDPSRLRTPRAPVYKDWSDAPHGR